MTYVIIDHIAKVVFTVNYMDFIGAMLWEHFNLATSEQEAHDMCVKYATKYGYCYTPKICY